MKKVLLLVPIATGKPCNLKEKIEKATGIPFFIDNDANVAALGTLDGSWNQPDVVL